MSFNILPQEFHVLSDNYVIRTRVPKVEISDKMVLQRVTNANLTAGDIVLVQCMNHERDELLHEASYRVTKRTDSVVVHEINDRDTRQVNKVDIVVERVGEWWASKAARDAVATVPGPLTVRWNPGLKVHQVLDGEAVVFESADKAQAVAVANGSMAA